MTERVVTMALPTRRSTIHLARRFASVLARGDLVVLEGPLGSGKTFWVRALCRALGLPESEPVTSPTFTLIQEIETRIPIAHADLYRLRSVEDVELLGLRSMRDEGRLVVVEWGTPYIEALGGDAVILSLSVSPRSARASATGPRSEEILGALPPPAPLRRARAAAD